MVLAAVPPSAVGVRPNSPPQTTSVSSSRPRDLRSCNKAATGRSVRATAFGKTFADVAVMVPTGGAAVINLDEAHTSLDQTTSQEALPPENVRRLRPDAIKLPRHV